MSGPDNTTWVLASLQVWHSHQQAAVRMMNYHLAAVPQLAQVPEIAERLTRMRDTAEESIRQIEELQAELQQKGSE